MREYRKFPRYPLRYMRDAKDSATGLWVICWDGPVRGSQDCLVIYSLVFRFRGWAMLSAAVSDVISRRPKRQLQDMALSCGYSSDDMGLSCRRCCLAVGRERAKTIWLTTWLWDSTCYPGRGRKNCRCFDSCTLNLWLGEGVISGRVLRTEIARPGGNNLCLAARGLYNQGFWKKR